MIASSCSLEAPDVWGCGRRSAGHQGSASRRSASSLARRPSRGLGKALRGQAAMSDLTDTFEA